MDVLLPFVLTGIAGGEYGRAAGSDLTLWDSAPAPARRGLFPFDFAEYLSHEKIIPFERSPLVGESLATLAADGFAAVVQLTRWAKDPVLWVEGATFLVLLGIVRKVAGAVGDVGADAVHYYLPRLLRLPEKAQTGRTPRKKR